MDAQPLHCQRLAVTIQQEVSQTWLKVQVVVRALAQVKEVGNAPDTPRTWTKGTRRRTLSVSNYK